MNVDIKKQEILNDLYTLENDCRVLLERIPVYREEVLRVKTEEEALEFDKNHDLEDGLKVIRLF